MALTTYRVQFLKPVFSYSAGEIAYFTAEVAEKLVADGLGNALDALPGTVAADPAAPQPTDQVTDAAITSVETAPADVTVVMDEAAQLPG